MNLDSIKPENTTEKALFVVMVLSLFSGWPSVKVGPSSVEPLMIGWVVGVLYFTYLHRKILIKSLLTAPFIAFIAILSLGTLVSILQTSRPLYILFQSGYFTLALLFCSGLYATIRQKIIRIEWLISVWVWLATIIATLSIGQFLIEAFTPLQVLREAYGTGVFSFPRVHGFAQEPLYFANWLLVPIIWLVYQRKNTLISSVLLLSLFLTLARGAFVAVGIVVVLLLVLKRNKKDALSLKAIVPLFTIPLVSTLILVGLSTIHNSNDRFQDGVGRYLDHASLGLFNYEGASNVQPLPSIPSESSTRTKTKQTYSYANVEGTDTKGVVEASTLGRLEAIEVGIDIFNDSLKNMLVGIGLYRFGEEASAKKPGTYNNDLISNNQFVQLLVETGIFGFTLFLAFCLYILFLIQDSKGAPFIWAFVALLIQYIFFSSYTLFPFWIVVAILTANGTLRRKAIT